MSLQIIDRLATLNRIFKLASPVRWVSQRRNQMDTPRETISVYEGMDVVGSDGDKLGSVDRVEGNYVVVKKGFFFPTDYYVPADAIAGVDEDRVTLNVPKDAVLDQGWDISPFEGEGRAGSTYVDNTAGTTNAAYVDDTIGTTDIDSVTDAAYVGDTTAISAAGSGAPFDHRANQESSHIDDTDSDAIRVPLAEEELTATRREVDRGSVRIEKDVETEEQALEVPVTEERVNVNRRIVDREVRPGDAAFEEDTIDVPVRGEEVDVQKQTRIGEEVEISKEAVGRTEHVSDTVRRERARVTDTTGDVDTDLVDDTRNSSKKNKGVI
jgi:uncharacterized protein (TIGR02271 family)